MTIRVNMLRFALAMMLLLPATTAVFGGKPAAKPVAQKKQSDLVWQEIKELGLEGQGWADTADPYDRLPARAQEKVRPAVWNLSRQSAGICVRFVSDATTIHAKWTLTSSNLAMPHMPATGVSGLDLYAKDNDGHWRWVVCGFPKAQKTEVQLISGLPEGSREYLLYLPLYNGVKSVSIGVSGEAKIEKAPARPQAHKPIVFYGTSITQGGCASRPGMVHTSILGRWLNRPVINLGFSGNGEMEAEVGELMAELDAGVFVIDCLPNMVDQEVAARTEPLVAILRKSHPTTPIVLVEDRNYTNSWILKSKRSRNRSNQAALKQAFNKLKAAGDENLYYIAAGNLLGDDNEGTVDSSHPTDLGFVRQAQAFRQVIGPLVAQSVN
jgi:hypothetical protein